MTMVEEETAAVTEPKLTGSSKVEERTTAVQEALRKATGPLAAVRSQPNAAVYAGVLLSTIGAILLAVAWGKVAGTESVSLQLPYVMSAGFSGLGLIVVGLTIINLSAKARDAAERSRQLGELKDLLGQMRKGLEEPAPAPRTRKDAR